VEEEDNFYIADRVNKCVVCGAIDNYTRFHVVPSLYRVHFPDVLKSHRSHDIVLLCFKCHERASQFQDHGKRQIAEEYGIPLIEHHEPKIINFRIQAIKKWAVSIVNAGKGIPKDRMTVLIRSLQEDLNFLLQNTDNIPEIIQKFVQKDPEGAEAEEDTIIVLKWCQDLQPKKLSNKEKQNVAGL